MLHLELPRADVLAVLLLTVVIIAGPIVVARARIPGIIGLILGGWLIGGPNGLELLPEAGEPVLKALGMLGLLYLMFSAGLELDLAVLRANRAAALSFGIASFLLPQAVGTGVSLLLGYELAAAVLIGSLWASHTLVTYPAVRGAGLAGNRLVATTVGATAITDTLALLVLAIVVSVHGGGSIEAITGTLLLGIVTLLAWSFGLLAWLSRAFFAGLGQHRTLRFAWLLVAMLSSAALAEVFGIEGIIGAFAAGLAINRLVPNEGPLMERVEFFGAALLVPSFLVSVGLVIDPYVLVQGRTLLLAAVFFGVVVVGKGLAAVLVGRSLGGSRAELGTMVGLSLSQAAATLAAAFVGLEVGILDEQTFNAVIGVIIASLVGASIVTERSIRGVAAVVERHGLGRRVLLARIAPEDLEAAVSLGRAVAAPEAGVVDTVVPILGRDAQSLEAGRALVAQAHSALLATGGDGDVALRVGESLDEAVRSAAVEREASMLLVPWRDPGRVAGAIFGRRDRALADGAVPTMMVRLAHGSPARIVLLATYRAAPDARERAELLLAGELAGRLARAWKLPLVTLYRPDSSIAAELAGAAWNPASGGAGSDMPAPHGGAAWLAEHAAAGDVVVVGVRLADSVPPDAARRVVEQAGVSIAAVAPAGSAAAGA